MSEKQSSIGQLAPSEAIDVLFESMKRGFDVLVIGKTGIGKTSCAYQAIDRYRESVGERDFLLNQPVTKDRVDYEGFPHFYYDEGNPRATFVPFDQLRMMIEAKRAMTVVLDDLGHVPIPTQSAIMQFVSPVTRQLNAAKISHHVNFIGTANRRIDQAGAKGVIKPLRERWPVVFELREDIRSWLKWAPTAGVDARVAGFLKQHPAELWVQPASRDETEPHPTPRTWENVSRNLSMNMDPVITRQLVQSQIGEAVTSTFFSFLELESKLPDPMDIYRNPSGTRLPSSNAQAYAAVAMLSRFADDECIDEFYTYMKRIKKKFSSGSELLEFFWHTTIGRLPSIKETSPWIDFNKGRTKL